MEETSAFENVMVIVGILGAIAFVGLHVWILVQIGRTETPAQRRRSKRFWVLFSLAWVGYVVALIASSAWGTPGLVAVLGLALIVVATLWLRRPPRESGSRRTGVLRRLTPAERAYAGFVLLGAAGLPVASVGALADSRPVLLAGLIMLGLFVLDRALVYPLIAHRRRKASVDR